MVVDQVRVQLEGDLVLGDRLARLEEALLDELAEPEQRADAILLRRRGVHLVVQDLREPPVLLGRPEDALQTGERHERARVDREGLLVVLLGEPGVGDPVLVQAAERDVERPPVERLPRSREGSLERLALRVPGACVGVGPRLTLVDQRVRRVVDPDLVEEPLRGLR